MRFNSDEQDPESAHAAKTEPTCRMPQCQESPRASGGTFATSFCSDQCMVRYEHIKADAGDARRAELANQAEPELPPEERGY